MSFIDNDLTYFRIAFCKNRLGHTKYSIPYQETTNDMKELFNIAKNACQNGNNDIEVDQWHTFFVVSCDKNGLINWNNSRCHGWKWGGRITYP